MNTRQLSEEEVDAEIEKRQQKITLALQQIDENFATCNQIVTSKIVPGIEQYGEASHQIWEFSKTWLHFFSSMNQATAESVNDEESEYSTNRPAFDDSSAGSFRLNHNVTANDLTNVTSMGGLIRKSLRQPPSATTIDTTTEDHRLQGHYVHTPGNNSMSSSSTASNRPPLTSPPRNTPFRIDASSLRGTPVHEQARILTDHTFRELGIRDSDSDTSDNNKVKRKRVEQVDPQERKASLGRAWQESNMDQDDPESRAKFIQFLKDREVRLHDMPEGSELKTIRPTVRSPSDRTTTTTTKKKANQPNIQLAGTPTMERVATIKQKDLRTRNEDSILDFDVEIEDNISAFAPTSPGNYSFHAPTFTPLREPIAEDISGAYEFSHSLNQYTGTPSSTRTGETDMTMKQGQHTSLIPAQFSLQYFPEKFQSPPASTKLTRVYKEFNDRPGTMLTIQQVMDFINDATEYKEEYVSLLISLLTRKKYLKKVGHHDAWVIRR